MRPFRLYKQVLIVILVTECLLVVPSKADTVPWLTGTFDVEGSGNLGTGENVVFKAPYPPFIELTFSPPSNLPSQTRVICEVPPNCLFEYGFQTLWYGGAFGGTADLLAQFTPTSPTLSMTGRMAGGVINGFREELEGVIDFYANQWEFDFTFRGSWSNGWWSEGSSDILVGTNDGDTSGSLAITTYTSPEPGTIALLGTGILGSWQTWKRRSVRSNS